VARFGMRSKPKPFTRLPCLRISRDQFLPDVDDPENSAIDAVILARYIWLSASRYPEQSRTMCLCVSEHLNSAYVIPAAGKSWHGAKDAPCPQMIFTAGFEPR